MRFVMRTLGRTGKGFSASRRPRVRLETPRRALVIRVRVPGTLAYRNLALRVVAAACKMIGNDEVEPSAALDELEAQTVSAVGEAYNNIAIHAYDGIAVGEIDISIESAKDAVTIEIT